MPRSKQHRAIDVFTPTKPARLTFVERETINELLVDALRTPGLQVIVYGPSGSGKTTLLVNKLQQLYENHITTSCTVSTSFEGLLLSAFDKLEPYFVSGRNNSNTTEVAGKISAEYLNIKTQINASKTSGITTSIERVLPIQLTPERLAEFCGAAGCCWVIEDFHKVNNDVKTKLSQVFKVFMDAADRFGAVKIVAIGAVNTARQVVKCEPEMINRVAEVHVPVMRPGQVLQIIDKGQELLNFQIREKIKREIADYSGGLAAVAHQLCLNICSGAGIDCTCEAQLEISDHNLATAVERFLRQSSDSLRAVFDSALSQSRKRKYNNTQIILEAMVKLRRERLQRADIMVEIQKNVPEYPPGNLTTYLRELQTEERGGIITYDPQAKLYSFSRPIYRAYARCLFRKNGPSPHLDRDEEFLGVPLRDVSVDGDILRLLAAIVSQLGGPKTHE